MSRNATPAVFNAVSILFTSISVPSSSVPVNSPSEMSFFTSANLAITVFNAVPAVSGASRVVAIIYVKNAAVVSNPIPVLCAIEATLLIAIDISSVLAAVFAARLEYTSLICVKS